MKNLTKTDENTISELIRRIYASGSELSESMHTTGNPAQRITRKQQERQEIETAISAIMAGDLPVLATLVTTKKQANWHRPDEGWCLLDQAVRSGSVAIVGWLLDMGACPNTLFFKDRPIAMHKAQEFGLYFSPFASAIHLGQTEIVILILRAGASLDLPLFIDEEGQRTTCRDKSIEVGIWPVIEADLIEKETPVPNGSVATGRPRL